MTAKGNTRFALSKSGSGLKTILLTLINLYLIPELEEYKDKKIVYAFEELENNLHPAQQRKLFGYLYKYAENTGNRIILTTHSHVAINCFFDKEGTKLYHVIKSAGRSRLNEIENYIDKVEILEDLDVKASDILQSNGIIWVEGPSDRVYIKKWLEVFCQCEYEEGKDYQFLYYGGKLLAHYSCNNEGIDNLISVLLTNRNSTIVIDSDKRNAKARINDTKRRIQSEFENNKLLCWITKGKEIENYLSVGALRERFCKKFNELGQYEVFPEYIKFVDDNFSSHKVDFAKRISNYITAENSESVLDLKKKIEQLYCEIKRWNTCG